MAKKKSKRFRITFKQALKLEVGTWLLVDYEGDEDEEVNGKNLRKALLAVHPVATLRSHNRKHPDLYLNCLVWNNDAKCWGDEIIEPYQIQKVLGPLKEGRK